MIRYQYGVAWVVMLAMGSALGCGKKSAQAPASIVADKSAAPLPEMKQRAESTVEPSTVEATPAGEASPAGAAAAERNATLDLDPQEAHAAVQKTPPKRDSAVAPAAKLEPVDDPSAPPAKVPDVLLTERHESLVHARVGDILPAIELPKVGGGQAKLADLYGSAATVVTFWKSDRQMSQNELADLGPDVVEKYGTRGVAVVGIAVKETAADARSALQKAKADFPNLLDIDGQAFAKVGTERLPWTLVLDANGKIVWFDLEYSHATRRELQQALLAIVK